MNNLEYINQVISSYYENDYLLNNKEFLKVIDIMSNLGDLIGDDELYVLFLQYFLQLYSEGDHYRLIEVLEYEFIGRYKKWLVG